MDFLWDSSKVTDYFFWKNLLIVRAAVIVTTLLLAEYVIYKNPIVLSVIFQSLNINNKEVVSFDIPLYKLNSTENEKIIMSSYLWTVRFGLILTALLIWHSLIVNYSLYYINTIFDYNSVVISCLKGWSCYIVNDYNTASFNLLRFWFSWNISTACSKFIDADKQTYYEELRSNPLFSRSIPCYKIQYSSTSTILFTLIVSCTLCAVQFVVFDILVYMCLRTPARLFFKASTYIRVIFYLLLSITIAAIVINSFVYFNPAGYEIVLLMSMTSILYQATRCAKALNDICNDMKLKSNIELKQTVFIQELDKIILNNNSDDNKKKDEVTTKPVTSEKQ